MCQMQEEVTMKSFDYHLLNLPIKFNLKQQDNKTLVSSISQCHREKEKVKGTVLDFKALRDIITKCNGWFLIMHWF